MDAFHKGGLITWICNQSATHLVGQIFRFRGRRGAACCAPTPPKPEYLFSRNKWSSDLPRWYTTSKGAHMDFDTTVKLNIYETIAQTTQAPTSLEVAQALNAPLEEVQAAFERLHDKRLLVPEPGDLSRIRMAPPFSGVETPFRVKVQGKVYYANCALDALGISAALHQDALIDASDGHNGKPIKLEIRY